MLLVFDALPFGANKFFLVVKFFFKKHKVKIFFFNVFFISRKHKVLKIHFFASCSNEDARRSYTRRAPTKTGATVL